jgi:hypothetical protein
LNSGRRASPDGIGASSLKTQRIELYNKQPESESKGQSGTIGGRRLIQARQSPGIFRRPPAYAFASRGIRNVCAA